MWSNEITHISNNIIIYPASINTKIYIYENGYKYIQFLDFKCEYSLVFVDVYISPIITIICASWIYLIFAISCNLHGLHSATYRLGATHEIKSCKSERN
jgi:hypothetical protein